MKITCEKYPSPAIINRLVRVTSREGPGGLPRSGPIPCGRGRPPDRGHPKKSQELAEINNIERQTQASATKEVGTMITSKKRLALFPGLALTAMFGAGLLTLALPGQATATTAANAVIRNTATVSYDDAGGFGQPAVPASVDVTVNLVAATPTLNTPPDTTTPSTVTTNYPYTIRNNSNGPETFNLLAAYALTFGTVTVHTDLFRNAADNATITSITLGASSVSTAAILGATVLTVPNDGSGAGGNTAVNGIQAGDTVVIGANTYTVASTVDNATGTSTITLTTGLLAAAPLGTQIGEQGSFISRTTPTATVNNSTYTLTVSATGAAPAASDLTITTVQLTAALNVLKYVRNINVVPACSGGTTIIRDTGLGAGSGTYCTAGVTGNPGQTLEYLIGVTNPAGGAVANNVVISDPVPAFTTKVANKIAKDPGTGVFVATGTDAVDADFAKTVAGTVSIYAGTGGTDAGTGGSLAAGVTTFGAFQVTIQP